MATSASLQHPTVRWESPPGGKVYTATVGRRTVKIVRQNTAAGAPAWKATSGNRIVAKGDQLITVKRDAIAALTPAAKPATKATPKAKAKSTAKAPTPKAKATPKDAPFRPTRAAISATVRRCNSPFHVGKRDLPATAAHWYIRPSTGKPSDVCLKCVAKRAVAYREAKLAERKAQQLKDAREARKVAKATAERKAARSAAKATTPTRKTATAKTTTGRKTTTRKAGTR